MFLTVTPTLPVSTLRQSTSLQKPKFSGAHPPQPATAAAPVLPAKLNAALFAPTQKVFNFGTAGFRTDDELAYKQSYPVLTHAIADWVIEKSQQDGKPHSLLLGGDTRDKSRAAMPEIAKILNQRGIDVVLVPEPVPTPVLAHAAQQFKQKGVPQPAGAIVLTASHNPWPFYGLNFLTTDGAVAPNSVSKQFERRQTEPLNANLDRKAYGLSEKPQTVTHDPYPAYKQHLSKLIDLNKIAQSPLNIIYDPLYATGRRYLPRLLAEHGKPITVLHNTDQRPAGYQGMPEPTADQLKELSAQVKAQGAKNPLTLGMATDGDADRFGIQDETGRFLTPNEVLMLTLHHLTQNKGVKHGVVVRSQATSHALDQLAAQSGMKTVQTPVGYKYIAETFIEHVQQGKPPVVLGGESSGGLSTLGHIPEKDGILANLMIAELAATENKPLSHIVKDVKARLGQPPHFQEYAIKTPKGSEIMGHFAQLRDKGGKVAGLTVDVPQSQQAAQALQRNFGTQDGVKLYLENGGWLLVRKSGTEPLARIYTEVSGDKPARELHQHVHTLLKDRFAVQPDSVKAKFDVP